MSYLARLKKGEFSQNCPLDPPAKPAKAPSDPFAGTPGEGISEKQQEALDMLNSDSGLRYGIATDPDTDPVRVSVAIRGVAVVDLLIPANKWEPFLFLETLQQQTEAN